MENLKTAEETNAEAQNLKKKYGASASQIEEFLTEAKREYEKLINFDVEYAKFSAQKAKLIISLNSSYKKITDIRRKFSLDFCKRVTEQLKATDMMAWVQAMNNIANRAREIICNEIINNI